MTTVAALCCPAPCFFHFEVTNTPEEMCTQNKENTAAVPPSQSGDRVFSNLHYVPIAGFICSCLSILVPYCIAVHAGDVPAFLPYISDVGGDPPQSIIFGIGFTVTSIIGVFGMILKYFIVQEQNTSNNPLVEKINRLTFIAGSTTFVGVLLVALSPTGHQRRDGTWYWPLFVPHMAGAAIIFGVGYVIALAHLKLQMLLDPGWKTSRLFHFRVLLCVVGIVAMAVSSYSWPLFDHLGMGPEAMHGKEYPEGMWKWILAEWVMVIDFQVYVLTYLSDFRRATLKFRIEMETHQKES